MGMGAWIGIGGAILLVVAVAGYFLMKNSGGGKGKGSSSSSSEKTKGDSGPNGGKVLRQLTGKGGLVMGILKEGSGAEVKRGHQVQVHYSGWLEDGTPFDSSLKRGVPFKFVVGNGKVIQGWEEGVQGMKTGEKRKLLVPPGMGYGSKGAGGVIPPNATLIFHIELLKIG